MKISKRKIFIGLAVALGAVIAFFAIRAFIFSKLHMQLDAAIKSLNDAGYHAGYDKLAVHWGENVIEVHDVFLEKPSADTTCSEPEYVRLGAIRADGFEIFPLVFRNILSFGTVTLDSLRVGMRENSQLGRKAMEEDNEANNDLGVYIRQTIVNHVTFTYSDSVECATLVSVHTGLILNRFMLELPSQGLPSYSFQDLRLTTTEVELPAQLYRITLRKGRWNFVTEILRLDSIDIIPLAGKVAFGKQRGFEIDRFEGKIPFLEARDLSISFIDTAAVTASHVELQLYLKIFRDKRRPFVEKKKPLPFNALRRLPVAVSVDSLQLRKSYVQYEEFAQDATEPGMVYFDNLYASIYNIDNRAQSGSTRLAARSNLVGEGVIELQVNFPMEESTPARLQGSISDFTIPQINTMLIPSTNLKVESGEMEKLSFNFTFDESNSDGEVELNYENLKLAIFKESAPGEEADKDGLKSFIMNTFIFRTDMDENVREEKRTGAVAYERDIHRSIFNFWVKSLLSGIKSAYNLDKLEARKTEHELRKQKRLARREARKQQRRLRKKERG